MLSFSKMYKDRCARAQLLNATTREEAISTRPENATEDSTISLNTSIQKSTNSSVQNLNNICAVKEISGFKNGDYCYIASACHFMHIYIVRAQKNEDTNNYIRPEVSNIWKKLSKLKDNIPIYHPDVGHIVKVYSQKMKMFCRARIININSYTDINVFHIDYGFYENLPLSNIFELDKNLKNVPEAAFLVGMRHACNIRFSPRVADIFHKLRRKVLVIEFDEDSEDLRNVRFKNPSDGSYIDFAPPESVLEENIPMQSGGPVTFFYGGSPKFIYIRSFSSFKKFENILEQLKAETDKNLIKLNNPKLGNIVSVYSNKEGGMCRGNIISINAQDEIKCRLVDYGFIEIVSQVFELPKKYSTENIPTLSHKITLDGLTEKMCDHPSMGPFLSSLNGRTFLLVFSKKWKEWNKQVVLRKFDRRTLNEQLKDICT